MADKLKPCPFCGSEAKMTLRSVTGPFNIEVVIGCTNHLCQAKRSITKYLYHGAGMAMDGSAMHLRHFTEDLLDAGEVVTCLWNDRAEQKGETQ